MHQGDKDVFFRGPRGEVVNVSRSPDTFSWLPRIAFAPHDARRVHVLWQEIIFSGGSHGGDILFARSEDGGATFSEPLNLSRSVGGDGKGRISREVWDNGSLDLAVDSDGAVYAAWTDYEGALYLSVSPDGGIFSTPRVVAGSRERPARAPSLAAGPRHTLYLAWTHGEDPSADIRVARSTDGGARFGEPVVVGPGPAFSDAPKLVLDPRGVLHLAYAEADRIVYARSTDGARSFEPPRRVSGNAAGFPAIGADRDGNVCIVWERIEGRRPVGLGFTVSRNGGGAFTAPAEVPGSAAPAGGRNGSQQGLLARKLAVGPDGAAAVVNSTLEPGKRSRVWLVRGRL
ncbi:MAG TPA: sialidase family protein [Burkholderiales bacterium]|nr:sialidase family protein [Burkholderiales bacterium]